MEKCQVIKTTYEYVQKVMQFNDVAHDYEHVLRDVKMALYLAQNYKESDLFVVEMVALLHDVEDDKLESANRISLRSFLDEVISEKEMRERILVLVQHISYRKHPQLEDGFPIEGRIVQDADRLDAIGAIGIARTFAYSGYKGIKFYSENSNESTTIKHFEEKLLQIGDLMNTEEAKKIAIDRKKVIEQFYKQFLDENGGFYGEV